MLVWSPRKSRTSSTRCTISALPSPSATKTISLAALTTGMLKVMRSGGGLGESAIDSTLRAYIINCIRFDQINNLVGGVDDRHAEGDALWRRHGRVRNGQDPARIKGHHNQDYHILYMAALANCMPKVMRSDGGLNKVAIDSTLPDCRASLGARQYN